MDPMNSLWYNLEFQRQSSAEERVSAAAFAKPKSRPRKSVESWIIELVVPLFVLAAVVIFGVVCFLCPTFVS
jgi:hypothetical protein